MKKKSLLLIFALVISTCYTQIDLKTYAKKIKNGVEIVADNNEYCPVSVKIDFALNNMISLKGNYKTFVIPARTKAYTITRLKTVKPGKYGYHFTTKFNYGNHISFKQDTSYVYNLPFVKNTTFTLYQGYNGSFSHQNINALDFTMPVGTNVCAAREGVVIKVVDNNNKSCPTIKCTKYSNYILIYHTDGTFAEYAHLKKEGALVQVGETVTKGQLIAKSGNTGFSTGPHLHFSVFNQKLKTRQTIKTKFKVENGFKIEQLIEKKHYVRNYN